MPMYVGSVQTLQTLRASGPQAFSVGKFADSPSVRPPGSIRARIWALQPPFNDSFSGYLKEALQRELESAGRYRADSSLNISGVLLDNRLDAGVDVGTAMLSARFNVTKSATTVYDKTLTAQSRWESSFLGAVAVPAAVRNYVGTFQKLLYQLFSDPDFQKLTATDP